MNVQELFQVGNKGINGRFLLSFITKTDIICKHNCILNNIRTHLDTKRNKYDILGQMGVGFFMEKIRQGEKPCPTYPLNFKISIKTIY